MSCHRSVRSRSGEVAEPPLPCDWLPVTSDWLPVTSDQVPSTGETISNDRFIAS